MKPKKITAKQLARRILAQLDMKRSYGRFHSFGHAEDIRKQLQDSGLSVSEHQEYADLWTQINRQARKEHGFTRALPDPLARKYEIVSDEDALTESGMRNQRRLDILQRVFRAVRNIALFLLTFFGAVLLTCFLWLEKAMFGRIGPFGWTTIGLMILLTICQVGVSTATHLVRKTRPEQPVEIGKQRAETDSKKREL